MDQNKANYEEQIRAIHQRFAGRLPQFAAKVGEYWARLSATAWDVALAVELRDIAHQLAGAGTTFGFPDATRAGRELDMGLGLVLDRDGQPTSQEMQMLERQVKDLLSVLHASQA